MDSQTRIINHLELAGACTVHQLSQDLGLTKADIRYHLKNLIRNDRVKQLAECHQSGPGRPAAKFCMNGLPPARFLSIILDSTFEVIKTTPTLEGLNSKLAETVVFDLLTGIEDSGSPAVRLSKRIEHLSTLGFRIRWEAGPSGPVIQILKEPITAAIKNPQLARLILSNLIIQINKKSLA